MTNDNDVYVCLYVAVINYRITNTAGGDGCWLLTCAWSTRVCQCASVCVWVLCGVQSCAQVSVAIFLFLLIIYIRFTVDDVVVVVRVVDVMKYIFDIALAARICRATTLPPPPLRKSSYAKQINKHLAGFRAVTSPQSTSV